MNTDLRMLLASTVLVAFLVGGKGAAMWLYWSPAEVLGNREDPPPLPAWAWRADRAHRNMLENYAHFAVVVLLAYVAGLSNWQTALGATIFFWARLAHAVLYIGGIWRLRWIAFFAGVGGEILIGLRLLF
jgi:uncharacterized MAPEG superfamily protein